MLAIEEWEQFDFEFSISAFRAGHGFADSAWERRYFGFAGIQVAFRHTKAEYLMQLACWQGKPEELVSIRLSSTSTKIWRTQWLKRYRPFGRGFSQPVAHPADFFSRGPLYDSITIAAAME